MMIQKTLPDLIADELIARIFIGEYRPGHRLPAERSFAEMLGVDRTSLRMALRTLNRMNLIQSVRGSGITVMDYRKHCGLDFLAAIFDIPQLELGSRIKMEGLEAFNSLIPGMLYETVKGSFDARFAESVRDILQKQMVLLNLDHVDDKIVNELAMLELKLQEIILYQRGTTLTGLMANSSRAMRASVIQELCQLIDMREHVDFHQRMLFDIGIGNLKPADVMGYYHKHCLDFTQPLRDHYLRNEVKPQLLASPLESALGRREALVSGL